MRIDIKQSEICGLHYLTRIFYQKGKNKQKAPQINKKKEKQAQNES